MNLNEEFDLANAIFGSPNVSQSSIITATATTNSAAGKVTVDFGDGDAVEIPIVGTARTGDDVIVNIQNGYAVAQGAIGSGDSGGRSITYKRFVPDSSAPAQTLGTSVQALTNMGSSDGGTAPVSHVSTGTYSINEAGTWRVRAKLGMYPNSTAATRLCVGIYDTSVSGTRLSLGVQAVYNLTANSPSKVVTVECDYIGTFAAGDIVATGAFADVTNAKVLKSGGDLTSIVFEKVG